MPSGKHLLLPSPGSPQRLNSLPMVLAVSPDGRYAASVNAGYGTLESGYMESLAMVDTRTAKVTDLPEQRTAPARGHQTLYAGLTFSADGRHLYASMASLTDPEGDKKSDTGSGIAVYAVHEGSLTPERFLKLPPVMLASPHTTMLRREGESDRGVVYPSGIAAFRAPDGGEHLLVTENLTDSVADLNVATGQVEHRFDLTESRTVPGTYPIAVTVTRDGTRAFVALWNASEIAELDLRTHGVARKLTLMRPHVDTAAGSHPCALLLDEAAGRLYVALSNRDAVASVKIGKATQPQLSTAGFFDARLPGQSYFGAEPNALALDNAHHLLLSADMGTDSVAVFDTRKLRPMRKGMTAALGFLPAEEMPMALAFVHGQLLVANGRGEGTGPNGKPQVQTPETQHLRGFQRPFTYAPTLDYGSLQTLPEAELTGSLKASTQRVLDVNRMRAGKERIAFSGGTNPIRHVIYIIKENRTYDQIFGDLQQNGTPVGNQDPSLVMYGEDITPNLHNLALQFGVLDNFFDSGEVSGEGHVWSTAAIGTDYLEKTWQQSYRGNQHSYDYEGMVADGYPLLQHIPDVNEAPSGYLWTDLAAHGKSLYHFGEYISSSFCTDKKPARFVGSTPQAGPLSADEVSCPSPAIAPGAPLPAEWGGGTNKWPWAIPRLSSNTATKPELVGHFAPEAPDFNLRVPDQIRVEVFLRHLAQWKADLAAGHDTMPAFVMLRLPNDHTAGTAPGGPSPKSSVADNDLAVGRAVEAISHSAFWDSTAFFILEDDAQNGGDHVDAHRSLGLVISKYSPHTSPGKPAFVDSTFYSTVSMLRTIEVLLGLPPMNNNDAFAPAIAPIFGGPGDQQPYTADVRNRENGLIYTANKPDAPGAAESSRMDFRHADRADTHKLNIILWQDARGSAAVPPMLLQQKKAKKDDDDDD